MISPPLANVDFGSDSSCVSGTEAAGKTDDHPFAHGEFFGFLPVPFSLGPIPDRQGTHPKGHVGQERTLEGNSGTFILLME